MAPKRPSGPSSSSFSSSSTPSRHNNNTQSTTKPSTSTSKPSTSASKPSTSTSKPSPSPSSTTFSKPSRPPTKSPPQQHQSVVAKASSRTGPTQSARDVALQLWETYVRETPQRIKLVDVFLAYLVVLGVVQFGYCVLAGNYPFNAFLSGFSATVGQFVLTASLRMQSNPENKEEFKTVSQERAFADYVFGSLILHFFCVNFIN